MKERAVEFRESLIEIVVGNVLEIGPGQIAFPTPKAANVTLVDKLPSDLHKKLFPELGSDVYIVEPDFLVDLDLEGLSDFSDNEFDVVIASHMLEHLAQPFRMLDDVYRILKDEGIAIIFLPDRRRTFDRERNCPNFEHFEEEYKSNSRNVSDEDLYDYMSKVENYEIKNRNTEFVQLHLARSIHVHAWTDVEFVNLFNFMQKHAKFRFEMISAVSSSNNSSLEEFGFVIKKQKKENTSDLFEQWENLIETAAIPKIKMQRKVVLKLNLWRERVATYKNRFRPDRQNDK